MASLSSLDILLLVLMMPLDGRWWGYLLVCLARSMPSLSFGDQFGFGESIGDNLLKYCLVDMTLYDTYTTGLARCMDRCYLVYSKFSPSSRRISVRTD